MDRSTNAIPESPVHEPAGSCEKGRARSLAAVLLNPTLHKSVSSVFDQALVSGTSFVTAWMVARLSPDGKADLGTYSLGLTLVLFVRGLQEQVIVAPYMIFCGRREQEGLPAYTGSTVIHHLLLSFGTIACLLLAAATVGWAHGHDGLDVALWVLAGTAPVILLRDLVRGLAFAHLRPLTAVTVDIAVCVLQLGGLLALALFHRLTVPAVYAVMGGACAAAGLGWFLSGHQPMRCVRSQIRADWLYNWAFAKWALGSQLLGAASPYLLPWLLALARGRPAVGLLAASTTLVGVAQMFVTGVGNFLTPKAARAYTEGGMTALGRVLAGAVGIFALALGAFIMAVLAAGQRLPVLVYGRGFADCAPIIAVLSVMVLINSLGMVAGNGLWAMERPSAAFRADVYALLSSLATAACLIVPLGALGAAIAALAGTLVGSGMRGSILLRHMKSPDSRLAAAHGAVIPSQTDPWLP